MKPITAHIITLNEEHNIAECIENLNQLCDEVLVIDSGSSDKTVEIAENLGAIVIHQGYLGDGKQKNVAVDKAKNKWILSIDADERLTADAIKRIEKLDLDISPYDGYALKRRNFIGSRWIKSCGWYPDYLTRLYNKDRTKYSEVEAHSRIEAENVNRLNCDIIHYSYNHCGELFSKADKFSSRSAKMIYRRGRRANAWAPFLHGLGAFFKKYILQRGFLGGVDGMTVALSAFISSYLKYARLIEFQKDKKVQAKDLEDKQVW